MPAGHPERIVCLTEETTETLYLLGEDARIVGISGFTVRPPRARREKPKVSAFTSAKIDRIAALEPDLVLGFSDLQADIAAQLVRAGIEVHLFNHRSIDGILRMVRMLGGMIGCEAKAAALKNRGIRIAILYTEYLPESLTGDSWSMSNVNPYLDDVEPALKNCASPRPDGSKLYYKVTTDESISAALTALFSLTVQSAHLTR